MATPNIIPRANNEGRLGKSGTQWLEVHAQNILQNGASVASLASPVFTGSPEAPTPATSDNNTNIATTAWVRNVFADEGITSDSPAFTGSPTAPTPATSDNNTNIATTAWVRNVFADEGITSDSPAFTGSPTAPTPLTSDNTTKIATTAWVRNVFTDEGITSDSPAFTGSPTAPTPATSDNNTNIATTAWVRNVFTDEGITSDSPAFTGAPTAPTPATSDNNTNIATTAWVRNVITDEGFESFSGSFVDGEIPEYDTTTSSFVTSGLSASQLTSRSNHTGTQAQSTVTDLVSDLAAINANIDSHASNHTDGTDDIQSATTSQKGLMTAAFATKLDGIETGADVTDAINVQAAGAVMDSEVSSLSGIKTLTIPDNTTITSFAASLLDDSDAATMRTTLELGSTDTPEFTNVTASDPSNGFKYSGTASAKITLQDISSATNFRLPSGGSGVENLVDGDGRGVTDSDAFRTAIDVGATGSLLMDAASASAARSTLGSTTVGDAVFIAASEAAARTAIGSTATGDSLLTAASAAAARTAIGSTTVGDAVFIAASESAARSAIGVETAADIGFGFLSVATSASTTINTLGTFEVAAATGFQVEDATNFSVPSATSCSTRYDGTETKKFKVSIKASATAASNHQIITLAVGKNGGEVLESQQSAYFDTTGTDKVNMSAEAIIELATNDTIEAMVTNDTSANNITLDKCTVIITPIL